MHTKFGHRTSRREAIIWEIYTNVRMVLKLILYNKIGKGILVLHDVVHKVPIARLERV
jgi:hypothetical protein